MRPSAAEAYRREHVRTATLVGRIIALYDAIIEALRRAAEAARGEDIEARAREAGRALQLIAVLDEGLDWSHGADVARRLHCFYRVAFARVLQASLQNQAAAFEQQARLFASVREAWQQAERHVAGTSDRPGAARADEFAAPVEREAAESWSA